jgi:hypothetical protein
MAIKTQVVTVTTSATKLNLPDDTNMGLSVALYNSGAATVYVGGSAVTTANGFPLAAAGTLSIDLAAGEELYGIVASSTNTVSVLCQGVA